MNLPVLADTKHSNLGIPLDVSEVPRPVTSSDLITLREIGGVTGTGLSISPDGNYLAFELHQADVSANDYSVSWFIAATTSGGALFNVADGGDATLFRSTEPNGRINGAWISEYAKWPADSSGIAYRKALNGETQIWWSSRDGKERFQLTRHAADIEAFVWSDDSTKLYFTTDVDRAEIWQVMESRYRNGYVFDYEEDWSITKGRPFYPPYTLTGGRPRVWVYDFGERIERVATANEIAEYERLARPRSLTDNSVRARHTVRTSNDQGVAWLQADDPDRQGRNPPMTLYAAVGTGGREPVRCPAIECTGIFDLGRPLRSGLHWEAVEDEILFVRKEGEGFGYPRRTLYGWKIGQERVRKILTTDDWISDCSVFRGRAFCFRETPRNPRTIISINLADGSIETLVDPNPEFKSIQLGDVELFQWTNSYEHGTFGYLVKPPNYIVGKRYPLVFVGYRARDALRGGVGDEYPVHLLAKNGFVVLAHEKPTNYNARERYSDQLDITKAMWGPDLFDYRMPLASFQSAIRILSDRGIVDSTRVGVTGLSNGVGHVNYSLIHSDLFSAAITSSASLGPSNYFLLGASGDFFRAHRKAMGIGRIDGSDGFLWQHVSLALNAERVNAPILVNTSDHEHPMALEEVITLIEYGKPVEMVVYPDEGHIKWQPAHRLAVYERNVDWFNFWLRGIEDPAKHKAPQYERWRRLRQMQATSNPKKERASATGFE